MKRNVSVKYNYIMNVILTLSGFIFPMITFPYVSRVLSPVGIGKYSFAASVISYFVMFSQLGLPTYGIRTCAQVRDDKDKLSQTFFELFCINFIMVVVSYAALFLALHFVPKFHSEKKLILVSSVSILFTMLGAEWFYRALEKFSYITIRSLVFKVISVAAMFMFVRERDDYIVYAGISALAAVGSNVLNFINLRKSISLKKLSKPRLLQHMKPIIVFFAMSVATTIYTNLDNVMLGFMSTDTEVGYYSAATKMKTILTSVVTSLGTVLLPRISYYVKNGDRKNFYRVTSKAVEYITIVGMSLSVYFLIFAGDTIQFLSGSEFQAATPAMRLITPTVFIIGISNLTGIQILVPLGMEKCVMISEIAGAVVDVVINWKLIPVYGAAGAAAATTIAEIVVLAVQLYYIRDILPKILKAVQFKYVFIPLCVAVIVITVTLRFQCGNSFVQLLWTACLFFGVFGVGMLIMKEPLCVEIYESISVVIKKKIKSK